METKTPRALEEGEAGEGRRRWVAEAEKPLSSKKARIENNLASPCYLNALQDLSKLAMGIPPPPFF